MGLAELKNIDQVYTFSSFIVKFIPFLLHLLFSCYEVHVQGG